MGIRCAETQNKRNDDDDHDDEIFHGAIQQWLKLET